jgi:hypothetical protein
MIYNIDDRSVAMSMFQDGNLKTVKVKLSTVQIHPVKILKASVSVVME